MLNFLPKKSGVFFLCILLSTFFWFLTKLSKQYNVNVNFNVEYILPKSNVILTSNPPEKININIDAFGFDIVKIKFKKKLITVDLNDFKFKKFKIQEFSFRNQLNLISSQLPKEVELRSVNPEKIALNVVDRKKKLVPITVKYNFNKTKEYDIVHPPKVEPKMVLISGSKEELDTISFWNTKLIQVEKNESFSVSSNLEEPNKKSNLILDTNQCDVFFVVNSFTEKHVEVPVQLLNVPNGYKAKAFPSKVNVRFFVSIDNFNLINSNSFKIVYDFKNKKPDSKSIIDLEINNKPGNIKDFKLSPKTVEYLLIKND